MFMTGDKVASRDRSPILDAGRHHRARLGFILMSTDLAAEADFFDMVPPGVAVHITRLDTEDVTTNETLARHIDHIAEAAARIQPDLKPDVVSYSCTSGSIVIGEDRVMAEIAKGAPWVKPICLVQGVLDALSALGARRIRWVSALFARPIRPCRSSDALPHSASVSSPLPRTAPPCANPLPHLYPPLKGQAPAVRIPVKS